jgi:hypothetical protein
MGISSSSNAHNFVKNLIWTSFYSPFWKSWADLSFAPTFRVWRQILFFVLAHSIKASVQYFQEFPSSHSWPFIGIQSTISGTKFSTTKFSGTSSIRIHIHVTPPVGIDLHTKFSILYSAVLNFSTMYSRSKFRSTRVPRYLGTRVLNLVQLDLTTAPVIFLKMIF